MNRRFHVPTIAALCALSLTVAAASSARAEDPPAKAEVALKANPGKPAFFVFSHETAQELPLMGETVTNTANGTTEFSIEVKERAADGTATGVVRFGRMTGGLTNPLLGEKSFDSAAEAPSDPLDQLMAITVTGLAHSEFTVTLDAGGAITKVDGLDVARAAAAKRLGADDMGKKLLASSISEQSVKDNVAWALLATPVPAGTITLGQSWDDTDTIPGTARGVSMKTMQKFTVTAIDAESVTLTGKGTLDMKAQMRGGEPTIKETACASTIGVSRADGLPLRVTASLSLSAELAGGRGSMSQKTTTKTDRVKAWPSAKQDVTLPPEPAQPGKPGTDGAPAGK